MRRLATLVLVLAATLVVAVRWLREPGRGVRAAPSAESAPAARAAAPREDPRDAGPDGDVHRVPLALEPSPADPGASMTHGALHGTVRLRRESYRSEVVDGARAAVEAGGSLGDELRRTLAWAELLCVTEVAAEDVEVVLVRRADGAVPEAIARTRTDASGAFAFERVAPGPWEARVTPPDGAPRFRADRRELRGTADVRAGEVARVEIVLPAAGAAVAGRVLDEAGRPIAGAIAQVARAADVLLEEEWYGDAGIQEELRVATGGDGRYVLRGLVPSDLGDALSWSRAAGARERSPSMLVVTVVAEGFVRARLFTYPLTIELDRWARAYGERLCAWRDAGTLPLPDRDLASIHAAYSGGIAPVFDGDVQVLPDLVLARGAWVAGRVVDPDGAPLAEARVRAVALDETAGERAPLLVASPLAPGWVTADDDGAFRIDGLAPGRHALEVLADSAAFARCATLALRARDEVRGLELVVGSGERARR